MIRTLWIFAFAILIGNGGRAAAPRFDERIPTPPISLADVAKENLAQTLLSRLSAPPVTSNTQRRFEVTHDSAMPVVRPVENLDPKIVRAPDAHYDYKLIIVGQDHGDRK